MCVICETKNFEELTNLQVLDCSNCPGLKEIPNPINQKNI